MGLGGRGWKSEFDKVHNLLFWRLWIYFFKSNFKRKSKSISHIYRAIFSSFPVMRAKQRFESAAPLPPLFLQSDKRGRGGGAALAPTPRPDSIWRHYSNLPASLFESEGGRGRRRRNIGLLSSTPLFTLPFSRPTKQNRKKGRWDGRWGGGANKTEG